MDRVDLIESLTQKEIDIRFHYPHSSKLIRIRETVLALEAGKPIEEKASALLEELDGKSAFVTAAENVRSIMSQRKNETSYTKPSFQHNVFLHAALPWLFFNDTTFFGREFLAHSNAEKRLKHLWNSIAPQILEEQSSAAILLQHRYILDQGYFFVALPVTNSTEYVTVVAFTAEEIRDSNRCFALKFLDNPSYTTPVGNIVELYNDNSDAIIKQECPLDLDCFVLMLEAYLNSENTSYKTDLARIPEHDNISLIKQPNWFNTSQFAYLTIPKLVDDELKALFDSAKKRRTLAFLSDWLNHQSNAALSNSAVIDIHDYSIYDYQGIIIELAEPHIAPAPKFVSIVARTPTNQEEDIELEAIYTLEMAENNVSTPWLIGWVWGYPKAQGDTRNIVKYIKSASLDSFKAAMDAHIGTDMPCDIDNDEYSETHLMLYGVIDTYSRIDANEL